MTTTTTMMMIITISILLKEFSRRSKIAIGRSFLSACGLTDDLGRGDTVSL